jgi:hypothetical protein
MKHNTSQSGFAVVETALVIIALGLAGFTGWYIYNANDKSTDSYDAASNTAGTPSVANKKQTTSKTTADEDTASWYKYTSTSGAYSIKLPDGTMFNKADADSKFQSISLSGVVNYVPGKRAVVEGPLPGKDGARDGVYINYFKDADDDKAYLPDAVESSLTTNAGSKVTKYAYIEKDNDPDVGIYRGDKRYEYRIERSGSALTIGYDVRTGVTDQSELIEKMVKTATLN